VAIGLAAVAYACLTLTGSSQEPPKVPESATARAATSGSSREVEQEETKLLSEMGKPGDPTEICTRYFRVDPKKFLAGEQQALRLAETNGPSAQAIDTAVRDLFKRIGVVPDKWTFDNSRGLLTVRAKRQDVGMIERELSKLKALPPGGHSGVLQSTNLVVKMDSMKEAGVTLGSGTTPRSTSLTAEQAGALALQLANEKAQALYNCQPFRNGPPAELVQKKWVWHDRRTQGAVDIEASVRFGLDGAHPDVEITPLDSRPGRSGF
jgi:hypothetical protein